MAVVRFGDVVQRANTKVDKDNTDLEFYVGGEHFDCGEILVNKRGLIKGSTIGPMFYFGFKAGQVLIVSRNPHLRKAAMAKFDGICSEKTFVVESKDESVLLQEYLPFIVQSDGFWKFAEENKSGSVNFFVNWTAFARYTFQLPDIDEQKKLAELLWAANDTKEAYKKLLALTDELIKAQFVEMFGDPVTNTKDLQIVPFITFMTNIRYGTSQPPQFDDNGQYCFIRATNIKQGRIVPKDMKLINCEGASEIQKCRLDGGEIIIVRSGANTGDTCVVTDEYKGHYAGYDLIISLDTSKANPFFFNELLNTHYMQMIVKPLTQRSAQPHLNAEQVQNLPMLKADLSVQNQFADFVQQSNKSKIALQQTISSLENTIKSLMQQYVG